MFYLISVKIFIVRKELCPVADHLVCLAAADIGNYCQYCVAACRNHISIFCRECKCMNGFFCFWIGDFLKYRNILSTETLEHRSFGIINRISQNSCKMEFAVHNVFDCISLNGISTIVVQCNIPFDVALRIYIGCMLVIFGNIRSLMRSIFAVISNCLLLNTRNNLIVRNNGNRGLCSMSRICLTNNRASAIVLVLIIRRILGSHRYRI